MQGSDDGDLLSCRDNGTQHLRELLRKLQSENNDRERSR